MGSEGQPVDLSRLAQDARYELTLKAAESEEERTARLEREGREHKVRVLKEVVLFFVALLGAGVIGWYCVVVLTDTAAPEGAKKWAMSILSAAASGIMGYLLGKKA